MKKILVGKLICPSCLPRENVLQAQIELMQDDDILTGTLRCPECMTQFPIKDGIGFLDPAQDTEPDCLENKYEHAEVVSSYLWSHYGNLLDDELASDAYTTWAGQMDCHSGLALDLGGAVGRFTFEMSGKCDLAIGIDNSVAFIKTARQLMSDRELSFHLKDEGHLGQDVTIRLPAEWKSERVEFIVGDAQRIPFSAQTIGSVASLNLVDKVPRPLRHIEEMNRVATLDQAQFILSDPFSWSHDAAHVDEWLGGKEDGPFAGKGIDNIINLLQDDDNGLQPGWQVEESGHVWWKIRSHSNHYELIKSCFVKATR